MYLPTILQFTYILVLKIQTEEPLHCQMVKRLSVVNGQKHYKCVSSVFVIQKEFPFLICYSSVHNIKTQGNYVINLTIDYFSSNIWIFIVFLNIIFVLCLIV